MADGNLLVVDVDHLLGIFGNRSGVGCNEKLTVVLPDTNDHRRALACSNDGVGVATVDDSNGISANATGERNAHGLRQRTLVLLLGIFNELNEHLRIGVTLEGKALLSEPDCAGRRSSR